MSEETIVTENILHEQPILEKYSYSKIACYGQCKFKFLSHYLEKNYIFSDSVATEFGTAIHEAEESIAIAIRDGCSIDYKTIKNKFIIKCHKIAHKYPEEFFKEDKSARTYQKKMYEYLDAAVYRLEKFMSANPQLEIIGIEQKFEYDYDGVHSFTGSIDRAFRDKQTGEILIQDIKSWNKPALDSELKAPAQFTVYTIAANKLWGVSTDKIKCEYDLPLCDITQSCLSDNIAIEGRSQLDKWFAGIAKKDFKPTVSALCHWCNYNPLVNTTLLNTKPGAICPYFSTWQKSGDKVQDTLFKWEGLENIEVDRQLLISQLKQGQQNLNIQGDLS